MRRSWLWFLLIYWFAAAWSAEAATGRVIKVLPHFLDYRGRHALSPSLYERDGYQAFLRKNPTNIFGLRFDVQWRTKGSVWGAVRLKVELKGIAQGNLPKQLELERSVEPGGWLSHWSGVALSSKEYKELGEVTAWRVTLWEGGQLLGEQKSFLW